MLSEIAICDPKGFYCNCKIQTKKAFRQNNYLEKVRFLFFLLCYNGIVEGYKKMKRIDMTVDFKSEVAASF